ncbi:hypothetical protein HPB51_029709 [Rhipicephalus microplus]|uniref:HAT C-terminal dimerisation domain-containing protein n=1 Tax=Rhipicephalus microplus TaxID=6941 RepID=A0A9J6CU03_RHIMP|nr:hypothetical protein HPB51_029709 [Rhipicephalus microplus]
MRRREMMVAAVQLQVIFVLQSTLGKVTPLPLGNAQGRQEVPLRGTDDSGPINMSEVLPFKNDGNFRALLRMRAKCGDAALRAHIETSPANALYTSPKIQNELITLCVQFYLGDIPSANVIEAWFTLWVNKCCQIEEKNRPACALQALEMCNRDFFPNIHSLLSILATLPVSTSTPERTFSTLRRLKSYLRNHMNNDRLTGLALLSIHRELQVTPEQVLTEFCKLPRRKNFLV